MNSSRTPSIRRRSFNVLAFGAGAGAAARVCSGVERADWILTAGQVLTMDPARRVIPDGAVAIRGAEIVAVGTREEIEKGFRSPKRVARPNSFLLPGMINTHAHAAMSLLRGIADDKRLADWLENYIFPAEARNVGKEFCFWGTQLACAEMVRGGTTSYVDMYYFEEEAARATKLVGMRGVLGQTVIGFPVPDANTPKDALERCEAFMKQFAGDELITPAVAPHALYTNSQETLRRCRALADKYKMPLLIHVSETKKEIDDMKKQHGRSPVETLAAWGIFDGPTIAAHAVWVDAQDIKTLAGKKVGVAHCPTSNMKLASGVAPVLEQQAAGLRVGLGTDGPSGSNNDFHLLEELDLAAKLQKVTKMDPQVLPAQKALEMATIDGAHVIGRERDLGSLEAGKKADLFFLDTATLHATPSFDPYSTVVYAAKSADVQDVFVHGRLVVRGGKVLGVNEIALRAKALELQAKVRLSLLKKG